MTYYHKAEVDLNAANRFEYDANNNLIYQGISHRGAQENEAVWALIKYDYDVNNNLIVTSVPDVSLAGHFNCSWADRLLYNYV